MSSISTDFAPPSSSDSGGPKIHYLLRSFLLRASFIFIFLMGFSLPLSIALANIGFFSFAALLLLRRLMFGPSGFSSLNTPLNAPILSYCIVWVIAALLSDSPSRSLATFPRIHHFLLFFLLLWAGRQATHRMIQGYLWGIVLCSLAGTALYLYWNVVDPVGVPAWMSWFGDRIYHQLLYNRYRVYLFSHPMTFAGVLLPGFLILFSFFMEIKSRLRWLWFGTVVLVGLTLLLTQVRGPWVGAFIGALILSATNPRRAFFFMGGTILLTWFLLPNDIQNRITSFGRLDRDFSLNKRVSIWRAAWPLVRNNLMTGVGPGRTKSALEKVSKEANYQGPEKPEPDLHNLYLSELTAKGLLGLAAILFLLGSLVRLGFLTAQATASLDLYSHALGKALRAFFVVFPFISLTESTLWDAEVALTIWMLAACSFLLIQEGQTKGISP